MFGFSFGDIVSFYYLVICLLPAIYSDLYIPFFFPFMNINQAPTMCRTFSIWTLEIRKRIKHLLPSKISHALGQDSLYMIDKFESTEVGTNKSVQSDLRGVFVKLMMFAVGFENDNPKYYLFI